MIRVRPILFSGPMVRAILDGRKNVTRRVVRPHPLPHLTRPPTLRDGYAHWREERTYAVRRDIALVHHHVVRNPYGVVGDRLWVRETWTAIDERGCAVSRTTKHVDPNCGDEIIYRADERHITEQWRPSIHMPRWASRITLEVTSVRVDRLHAITELEAIREGVEDAGNARHAFRTLWDQINGKRAPWDSNPWVWRIEFRRVKP